MAVDLRFADPLVTAHPVDLTFGAGAEYIHDVNATVTVGMPAPTVVASAQIVLAVRAAAVVAMPAPGVAASAHYDNAVMRGPALATAARHQDATPAASMAAARHQDSIRLRAVTAPGWQDAAGQARAQGEAFGDMPHRRAAATARHQDAVPAGRRQGDAWGDRLRAARPRAAARHHDARPTGRLQGDRWQDRLRHARPRIGARHQDAMPAGRLLASRFSPALARPLAVAARHQDAWPPRPGLYRRPPVPPVWGGCYTPPNGLAVNLLFDQAADAASLNLLFRCGTGSGGGTGATTVVPIRRVYIVLNEVTLTRVENNLALPVLSLGLRFDADSWTFGFDASLPASSLDDVLPGAPGQPVELLASFNGAGFRLVAEKVARDRRFAESRIRVSGRGRSALLASPYAPSVSRTNATQMLAQQLAAEVLTVNGVGIGWDIDWQLTDWLVPAGAWAHQGDYSAALGRIAEAAGGIMASHRTAQTLIMAPRYPVLPWDWAAATPDLQLPAAAVVRESIEWVDKPAYNAVYVSGEGQGILGQATRAGTGGDLPAPMVVDALITAVGAARQRAGTILADTGRQLRQSLELPVLPETGVIDLNTLVEFVDGSTTRRGLVRGVSLSANLPSLTQTIEVECRG